MRRSGVDDWLGRDSDVMLRLPLVSDTAPEYYAQSSKGGHMPGSHSPSIRRRGITVLSLVLIIIAVVIAAILLVHYLGHRSVAT